MKIKAIELTGDNKAHLCEMVNKFFPKAFLFENDEGLFVGINTEKIHWFEFCFTYLAEAIIMYNAQGLGDLAYITMIKNGHPIEILYTKYKQG